MLDLADVADAVTLPRYRAADLEIRHKADKSHVTDADTGAEAAMRATARGSIDPITRCSARRRA